MPEWDDLTPEQRRAEWGRQRAALDSIAASAASTRRNVNILVWVFLWIPLILVGIGGLVWLVLSLVSGAAASSQADAYAKVQAVYTEVGYTPTYSSPSNQISGICENLRTGMSHTTAAQQMASGFGDLSTSQALKIVDAADRYVCSR